MRRRRRSVFLSLHESGMTWLCPELPIRTCSENQHHSAVRLRGLTFFQPSGSVGVQALIIPVLSCRTRWPCPWGRVAEVVYTARYEVNHGCFPRPFKQVARVRLVRWWTRLRH